MPLQIPRVAVSINAIPWAEVWIANERLGETPIGNLPLRIGPHEVVFRHPELGERRVVTTVTLPGSIARLTSRNASTRTSGTARLASGHPDRHEQVQEVLRLGGAEHGRLEGVDSRHSLFELIDLCLFLGAGGAVRLGEISRLLDDRREEVQAANDAFAGQVRELAGTIGSRPVGTEPNARARAYIVDQLKLFGYDGPDISLTAKASGKRSTV